MTADGPVGGGGATIPSVRRSPWRSYVVAIGTVALVTAIGIPAARVASHADQAMAYVLAIVIAALGGRGPGITASIASAAAFDFFFVQPLHTFAIADTHFLITFAVMLAVGFAIGTLVTRSRSVEAESRAREIKARAEELRSTLLSSVSHDLRTPLAAIIGMATSLRDRAGEDDREALDTIVDESRRLSRILTNLLSITKVESGAEPRREWVPLDELIGSALSRFEPDLVSHPVTLEIADELAHVDPILTEQLLVNLVDNAVKHTPPTCPIEVRAYREISAAIVEIADRGPGLPSGPIAQVFDKFFHTPSSPGVGLGLAVCRGIALAHGGRIEAAPRDGGGVAFRVRFPDDGAPPTLEDA